jgi:hypothetical protein
LYSARTAGQAFSAQNRGSLGEVFRCVYAATPAASETHKSQIGKPTQGTASTLVREAEMPQFRANYSGNYHLFVSRDDSNGHAAFIGRNDLGSARIPGGIKFHADEAQTFTDPGALLVACYFAYVYSKMPSKFPLDVEE